MPSKVKDTNVTTGPFAGRDELCDASDFPELTHGATFTQGASTIHFSPVEALYQEWESASCIISDGPYGISGFPGDCHTANSLPEWYEPDIQTWGSAITSRNKANMNSGDPRSLCPTPGSRATVNGHLLPWPG